jgi:hypothetical protein
MRVWEISIDHTFLNALLVLGTVYNISSDKSSQRGDILMNSEKDA